VGIMSAALWAIVGFFVATIAGWLLDEFHESGSWLATRLTQRAAARCDPPFDAIRLEEWTRELEDLGGMHLMRLLRAVGFEISSLKMHMSVAR
jgi:hypothetical protein